MSHTFSSYSDGDDDELDLQLEEPSQMRDEELGDHRPNVHGAAASTRGPVSPDHSGLQMASLYSGIDQHTAEREALHDGGGGGDNGNGRGFHAQDSRDIEVMENADVVAARRVQGGDDLDADAEDLPDGGDHAGGASSCPEWCRSKNVRCRILACAMVVLILWIPVIYLWSTSSSSSSSDQRTGAQPSATIECFPSAYPRAPGSVSTMVQGQPDPFEPTPPDTIVAYVGDVGIPVDTDATGSLYELIRSEGAHALVIQGDLDYNSCPGAFEAQLSKYFPDDFPVFPVSGNHDELNGAWGEYSAAIARRWESSGVTTCAGKAGEESICTFKGIVIVQTSPGIFAPFRGEPSPSSQFLRSALAQFRNTSRWLTCSWHKNQIAFQTEGKSNDVGYSVYEACREAGALIATGHDHAYSRSFLMESMNDVRTVSQAGNASFIPLRPGASMLFVNGLGGKSVRHNTACPPPLQESCPWFAHVENLDTGFSEPGAAALFCKYAAGGNPNRAECYLRSIDSTQGRDGILDEFTLDASLMPQVLP